jgi:hypothetical protein
MAASAAAAAAVIAGSAIAAPMASAYWRRPPLSYQLAGDPAGSTFEGIGVDERSGLFYVTEVTGGAIHRGVINKPTTQEWLGGEGIDGRWTARGMTVDKLGRVYIAGGPNSTVHPGAPDLWVYSSNGALLAALNTGVANVMINDVTIGADGAAYFTDSNTPRVFRVSNSKYGWTVTLWKDASAEIKALPGFNLNGIVATPDGKALLSVQSNAGRLWRFDLRTRRVTSVAVRGAELTSGDGLVLKGHEVTAVRNFARVLTTLKLNRSWTSATLVKEVNTPKDRVLTTAKIARGRLLAVDSKFEERPALPPYEVLVLPVP